MGATIDVVTAHPPAVNTASSCAASSEFSQIRESLHGVFLLPSLSRASRLLNPSEVDQLMKVDLAIIIVDASRTQSQIERDTTEKCSAAA